MKDFIMDNLLYILVFWLVIKAGAAVFHKVKPEEEHTDDTFKKQLKIRGYRVSGYPQVS